jgi:hypothetical protein
MNINQLIERLPKHPLVLMQNALGRKVSIDNYYLYGIIRFDNDFYKSYVFTFNSITEFVAFLPAIVFNDVAINWEEDYEVNNVESNFSDDYKLLEILANQNWDELKCKEFIGEHSKFDDLELIEFGRISDFMEATSEEFIKSKEHYVSLDELEKIGITQCRYQVLYKFSSISQVPPSQNRDEFLKMMEDWD